MLSSKSDKPYTFEMRIKFNVKQVRQKPMKSCITWKLEGCFEMRIRFNVKQVQQKPMKVCITWKVVGCLKFYIFPG